ncbi:MAG: HEAT repeat domain-containing protein [Verrucomicrobiae bacterium]|nr:HEAT repeat domain-containing protein [Verrucomicrobiae bacterium]
MGLTLAAAPAPVADLDRAVGEAMQYQSGRSAEPLRQIEAAVREAVANRARRAAVEQALVRLLSPQATFEARRFACTQLAILGGDSALGALGEMLQQPETAGIACLALASNPSAKVTDLLLKALDTAPPEAREQIVVTLGDRRAPAAVKALLPLTRDTSPALRTAAMVALGKIASPPALEALAGLRRSPDAGTARAAVQASLAAADAVARARNARAAAAIYEELLDSAQPVYVRRAALEGLLRLDADGGQQRALAVLRGPDSALKPSALYHVRHIPGRGVSAVFAAELPRLATAEQVLLLDSLAARKDADALQALKDATQAPAAAVRQAAVKALAQVGDASAVPVLVKALVSYTTAAEQQTVEMALASLPGGAAVDEALVQALQTSPPAALPGLMNAAGRRGVKAAVPVLLKAASSENLALARAAFRALGRLATPADLPALVDGLTQVRAAAAREDAESTVIKILEREPDAARRVAVVREALQRAPADVTSRVSLLRLLPACGGREALALLQAERRQEQPALRDAALRALAEWPEAAAVDVLLAEAQQAAQNTERVLALRGVARLLSQGGSPPAQAAAQFEKAMALARTDAEKKLIISAMSGLQHEMALRLLEPLLDNPAVRNEAEQAALRLAPRLAGAWPEAARRLLNKLAASPAAGPAARGLLETLDQAGGFLLGWQVAGPFTAEGKDGQALFDTVFPPEQNPVPAGVAWQLAPVGTLKERPWQVNLAGLFAGDHRVAYARVWVHSDTAQPARLELGADDGLKVWFNGRVVLAANRGGDVQPGEFKAEVALQPGWNQILLKVTQWTSGWGFCARLVKPDGTPLAPGRLSPYPPETP